MKPWQYCNRNFTDADRGDSIGFLYCVFFPNGKRYIGQKTYVRQWESYPGSGAEVTEYVAEHGTDNLRRVILELFDNQKDLDDAEEDATIVCDAVKSDKYMNRKYGGNNHTGYKHTAKTRAKMSDRAKNRPPEQIANFFTAAKNKTPEHKAKIGAANKGRKRQPLVIAAMKGRKVSAETRAKISKANKGRKRSAEARARMSEAAKRNWATRVLTTASRAKIVATHTGNTYNLGKKRTAETKAKMSVSQRAAWNRRKTGSRFLTEE